MLWDYIVVLFDSLIKRVNSINR